MKETVTTKRKKDCFWSVGNQGKILYFNLKTKLEVRVHVNIICQENKKINETKYTSHLFLMN